MFFLLGAIYTNSLYIRHSYVCNINSHISPFHSNLHSVVYVNCIFLLFFFSFWSGSKWLRSILRFPTNKLPAHTYLLISHSGKNNHIPTIANTLATSDFQAQIKNAFSLVRSSLAFVNFCLGISHLACSANKLIKLCRHICVCTCVSLSLIYTYTSISYIACLSPSPMEWLVCMRI